MANDTREKITADMTVRDVNMKYPQAMTVFDKYGIAGCGGKYGPPESLNFFAQAHKVDCDELIGDLEKAIRGEVVAEGSGRVREESTLYRGFVKAAIVCGLTAGAGWGTVLLSDIAFFRGFSISRLAYAQTHANVQVYGWAGLFIMGFAYHAIPRFKNTPLRYGQTAFISLILVLVSLLTRFISQPFVQGEPIFGGLLISSGLLLALAYVSFLFSMVATIWKAESETEFYEKFVVAALAWGLVSVVVNLSSLVAMVNGTTPLLTPATDEILRHIQLYGFIGLMIIGVSYRLLPGFLGIDTASPTGAGWAFALFNIGIVLWLWGALAGMPQLVIVALAIQLAATLVVVLSLAVFRHQHAAIEIEGGSPVFRWYIRLAYAWLIVGLMMATSGSIIEMTSFSPQAHAFIDAYRHALAMGFVTTMILGVAQRVIPVWEGKELHSPALMVWVLLLVTVGTGARVLFQAVGASTGSYLIGSSGYLQFAAIALFSYNIWKTLNLSDETVPKTLQQERPTPSHESKGVESRFGPKTKVFEILHEFPGSASVLSDLGIGGLTDGGSIPKFLTVERLCRSNSVEIEAALGALEEYCSRDG